MADKSTIIKVGLVGVAGYLAYKQGWLASILPASGTPAPTPVNTAALPVAAPPSTETLTGVQARTIAKAGAPAAGLTMDQWGWHLNNELVALGKPAPDPLPLFGGDRSRLIPAADYWAVMGPALKSQVGLTGLGLYWAVN